MMQAHLQIQESLGMVCTMPVRTTTLFRHACLLIHITKNATWHGASLNEVTEPRLCRQDTHLKLI